jgi:sensor c-di-GMP phosphodiesterase-like protein
MMSEKSTKTGLTIAAIVFAVLMVAFIGTTAYYYETYTSTNNNLSSLQTQYNTLKTADNANLAKIDALNSQITQLQGQNTADQNQIASLTAQVNSLEAANVVSIFDWNSVCTSFLCIFPSYSNTVTSISFANTGTITANSATIKVSFYSGPSLTGTLLCTTSPINLGNVSGGTIQSTTTGASCGSGSTQAQSASGTVTWS